MKKIQISKFRKTLHELIKSDESIIVTKHGREIGVFLNIDDYNKFTFIDSTLEDKSSGF